MPHLSQGSTPTSVRLTRKLLVPGLTVAVGLSVFCYSKAVQEVERLRRLMSFRGSMRE